MRSLAALSLALLATVVMLGCGEKDEATTPATSTPAAPTPHDPGAGAEGGPFGELTAAGIGPVEVGASGEEIEAEFGEPIETIEVDFGGGKSAPQENWIYRFPKGDVTLKFDTKSEAFAAYDVYTPELATDDGIRVGDPEALLKKRYGGDPTASPLGLDTLVLSAAEPGTTESPALSFAIERKRISAISGGDVIQPAGE